LSLFVERLVDHGRFDVKALPTGPGVYRFRDARGRALYIGRAVNLRRRVTSYWRDLRDRSHLAPMVAQIACVEAVSCVTAHEATWLERNLLETSKPRWNRAIGGAEVPVYLRLADRIEVVDDVVSDARHFGPYLGGTKVRRAAIALNHALSLDYVGRSLRGAEAELARLLGIPDLDPAGLRRAAAAVLARDPAAVAALRVALVSRRDRAAEIQAYELAGRLQLELAAIDWVSAEQRVTALEPYDAEICGWCDGVLVRFTVRGGRMTQWSIRRCGRPATDATPPEWAEFAQANAELAAQLAKSVPRLVDSHAVNSARSRSS
jgi:excinuclease ABC subunit C